MRTRQVKRPYRRFGCETSQADEQIPFMVLRPAIRALAEAAIRSGGHVPKRPTAKPAHHGMARLVTRDGVNVGRLYDSRQFTLDGGTADTSITSPGTTA